MKRRIKILSLFIATFFLHGFVMGEQAVISEADSAHPKAVSHSSHSSDNSYFFAIHQQAENGINISRLLNEIQLSESQDHSFEGVLVEEDMQRQVAIFLHTCWIINQYSELTKLIYPFHFFF